MVVEAVRVNVFLRYSPSPDGYSRLMNAICIARFKRMPGGKALTTGTQTISASTGQPIQPMPVRHFQIETAGHQRRAPTVIGTSAGLIIQIPASHLGIDYLTVVFVFQFVQATLGATVTERFPLSATEFVKSLTVPPVIHRRVSCPLFRAEAVTAGSNLVRR